jgi:hypothetical protein
MLIVSPWSSVGDKFITAVFEIFTVLYLKVPVWYITPPH